MLRMKKEETLNVYMFIRSVKILLQKMRETVSLQLSERNWLFLKVLSGDTYLEKGDPARLSAQLSERWRKMN